MYRLKFQVFTRYTSHLKKKRDSKAQCEPRFDTVPSLRKKIPIPI
jgi:hypothetical protein